MIFDRSLNLAKGRYKNWIDTDFSYLSEEDKQKLIDEFNGCMNEFNVAMTNMLIKGRAYYEDKLGLDKEKNI
jgi:hypothetical protein